MILKLAAAAILVDGNNIERSIQELTKNKQSLINFDTLIPKLIGDRSPIAQYTLEKENKFLKSSGASSPSLPWSVCPCHKSADSLTIKATQLASKVDTIIIKVGDSDYIEFVRHLKSEGVRVEIAAILTQHQLC